MGDGIEDDLPIIAVAVRLRADAHLIEDDRYRCREHPISPRDGHEGIRRPPAEGRVCPRGLAMGTLFVNKFRATLEPIYLLTQPLLRNIPPSRCICRQLMDERYLAADRKRYGTLLVFTTSERHDSISQAGPSPRWSEARLKSIANGVAHPSLVVTPVDLNRGENANLVGSCPPSNNQSTCDQGLSHLFLVWGM